MFAAWAHKDAGSNPANGRDVRIRLSSPPVVLVIIPSKSFACRGLRATLGYPREVVW